MSMQTWRETIHAAIKDAVQVANTVTETILIPDTPIPARFWYPQRTLKISLRGALSNVVTTPGTFTIRARYGGVAGTVLAASAALALNTTAKTGSQIKIDFYFTCRDNGWSATSGVMWTTGEACLGDSASVVGRTDLIPVNGNAAVSSLDLFSAGTLSITGQFSVATNPTNVLIQQALIDILN